MADERIAALAADRISGASDIVGRAVEILRGALSGEADVLGTARALVRAQPSMAPVWNAAVAALQARDDVLRFEGFAGRVARAPRALTRFGLEVFAPAPAGVNQRGALHVVTLSCSGSVLHLLEAVGRARSVRVSCGEGRPMMEGRTMAARLAAAGIAVTVTTDAALGQVLGGADAVVIGADAVTAAWVINKAGTRMLVAAAAAAGIPVYVVAGRDKFAAAAVAARLTPREEPAAEVWSDPPAGVAVSNVYFEPTPLDTVTGLVTDSGVLDATMARQLCESLDREAPERLVALLDT
jgi:translation initiation factor 2B subunit (eIF-2B alpha/beta/delta family)